MTDIDSVVTESAEIQQIRTLYAAGQDAFERGRYREAIQHLAKASGLSAKNSSLGGEIQLWLVTAYEAAGEQQDAINLCRQLNQHPDLDTRQQSRRLLYILEAPKLNMRPEWVTQIPDLSNVTDRESTDLQGRAATTRPAQQPIPPVTDLSQVNTKDNQFLWIALIAIGVVIGGLAWFSQS